MTWTFAAIDSRWESPEIEVSVVAPLAKLPRVSGKDVRVVFQVPRISRRFNSASRAWDSLDP